MLYSEYLKRRALYFHRKGFRSSAIVDALASKGEAATRLGIAKMLKRVKCTVKVKWEAIKDHSGCQGCHRRANANRQGDDCHAGRSDSASEQQIWTFLAKFVE